MLFHELTIYKDIIDLSKFLHKRINKMPRFYKFDIGEDMKKLIREIRYYIYLINSHEDKEKYPLICQLLNKLVFLKIMIDELVEDHIFVLNGKGNIIQAIKLLTEITTQATKWRNYTKRYNV